MSPVECDPGLGRRVREGLRLQGHGSPDTLAQMVGAGARSKRKMGTLQSWLSGVLSERNCLGK